MKIRVLALFLALLTLVMPMMETLTEGCFASAYAEASHGMGAASTEPMAVGATEFPAAELMATLEPTAVPTPEPTATLEPTAVPTPEPIATPEPTAVPTPEPIATPEPTVVPTATPEPAEVAIDTHRDASFSPAFAWGWVEISKNAPLLEIPGGAPFGTLSQGVGYALSRSNPGRWDDCLAVAFGAEGATQTAYIPAGYLRPLSQEEIAAYLSLCAQSAEVLWYQNDSRFPLLPVKCRLIQRETSEPTVTPVPEEKPTPTPEPADTMEPAATPAPEEEMMSAREPTAVPTPEPADTPEPTATPAPEEERIPTPEPVEASGKDGPSDAVTPASSWGWVEIARGAPLLKAPGDVPFATLSQGVGYALSGQNPGEEHGCLTAAFKAQGITQTACIPAEYLRPLSEEEIAAYLSLCVQSAEVALYQNDLLLPLLPVGYTPAAGGEIPVSPLETELYNAGDIAVVNEIIAYNGLSWTSAIPSDGSYVPGDWEGVTWSKDALNKRVIMLNVFNRGLTGSLDVSGLTGLQALHCYENQLIALDISGCTELVGLWCFGNRLSQLDVSNCPALIDLLCDVNDLSKADVSGMTEPDLGFEEESAGSNGSISAEYTHLYAQPDEESLILFLSMPRGTLLWVNGFADAAREWYSVRYEDTDCFARCEDVAWTEAIDTMEKDDPFATVPEATWAIVTEAQAHAYRFPDEDLTGFLPIAYGDVVEVLMENSSWALIRVQGAEEGYIRRGNIAYLEKEQSQGPAFSGEPADQLTLADFGMGSVDVGMQRSFARAFAPPNPQTLVVSVDNEDNAHSGKPDGDLNDYLGVEDWIVPIEVRFDLTELPSQYAHLAIHAWDCDEENGPVPEYDEVYVNGQKVGVMTGEDGQWNTTLIKVPVEFLQLGANYVSVTLGARNLLTGKIYYQLPDAYWMIEVKWVQLLLDGGNVTSKPDQFNVEITNAKHQSGMVYCDAEVTIDAKQSRAYAVEYSLVDNTTPASRTYLQIISTDATTVTGTMVTTKGTLRLPLNAGSGEYLVQVLLKDRNTSEILAVDEIAFDFTSGIVPSFDITNLKATLSTEEKTSGPITMYLSAKVNDPGSKIKDVSFYVDGKKVATKQDKTGIATGEYGVAENGQYLVEVRYTKDGQNYNAKLYKDVFNITPKSNSSIYVSPAAFASFSSGETEDVNVYCSSAWTATSDASWVSFQEGGVLKQSISGNGDKPVTIVIQANTTGKVRTATVTFVSGNVPCSLPVIQSAAWEGLLESILVKPEGMYTFESPAKATKEVEVISNSSWTATITDSWVSFDDGGTLKKEVSGTGNKKVKIVIAENTTLTVRLAAIPVNCKTVGDRIVIVQHPRKDQLALSANSITLAASGSGTTSDAMTLFASDLDIWSLTSDSSWLKIRYKTYYDTSVHGSASGSFTVTATDNPNATNRSAIITAKIYQGKELTIAVTQKGMAQSSSNNSSGGSSSTQQNSFKAVTSISGVPMYATVGTALKLTGTVVPANATNKTISWSVESAGGTGAVIKGDSFTATATGTATVKATIKNGKASGKDYTQSFKIDVTAPPVYDATNISPLLKLSPVAHKTAYDAMIAVRKLRTKETISGYGFFIGESPTNMKQVKEGVHYYDKIHNEELIYCLMSACGVILQTNKAYYYQMYIECGSKIYKSEVDKFTTSDVMNPTTLGWPLDAKKLFVSTYNGKDKTNSHNRSAVDCHDMGFWSTSENGKIRVTAVANGTFYGYDSAYGRVVVKHKEATTGDGVKCERLITTKGVEYEEWYSRYVHMTGIPEKFTKGKKGTTVMKGEFLGYMSNISPDRIGVHLHFQVTSNPTTSFGISPWYIKFENPGEILFNTSAQRSSLASNALASLTKWVINQEEPE